MASKASNRPLSPHLMHVRWPINMMVSIIHRATGSGMATIGTALLVWWLAALAAGKESYDYFMSWFTGDWAVLGYVVAVGLTLSLFQHMMSGIRHLVMDTGAGFELKRNRMGAWSTMIVSVVLTALYWAYILGGK